MATRGRTVELVRAGVLCLLLTPLMLCEVNGTAQLPCFCYPPPRRSTYGTGLCSPPGLLRTPPLRLFAVALRTSRHAAVDLRRSVVR